MRQMAKRKKAASAYQPLPLVRKNFRREITQLLGQIPAKQWDDPDIRGVLYEFTPWDRISTVVLQTDDDDPRDIGDWKYYDTVDFDGECLIDEEFEAYHNADTNGQLVYHKLLIEAAEALLSIKFEKYNNPKLPARIRNLRDWTAIDDRFCLNKTFLLQVYDADESFQFNYCEYVLTRRLEPTQPNPASDQRSS